MNEIFDKDGHDEKMKRQLAEAEAKHNEMRSRLGPTTATHCAKQRGLSGVVLAPTSRCARVVVARQLGREYAAGRF